jgi:hypothetical protein
MTLATACFDTDSSVVEESSTKFWHRKPTSDDSGRNDNQDSDNDSWPSTASDGSISISFDHEPDTKGKKQNIWFDFNVSPNSRLTYVFILFILFSQFMMY